MSESTRTRLLQVGDRVRVTNTPFGESLPAGTPGTVVREHEGYYLWVVTPGYPDPVGVDSDGVGWALTADEVEKVEA